MTLRSFERHPFTRFDGTGGGPGRKEEEYNKTQPVRLFFAKILRAHISYIPPEIESPENLAIITNALIHLDTHAKKTLYPDANDILLNDYKNAVDENIWKIALIQGFYLQGKSVAEVIAEMKLNPDTQNALKQSVTLMSNIVQGNYMAGMIGGSPIDALRNVAQTILTERDDTTELSQNITQAIELAEMIREYQYAVEDLPIEIFPGTDEVKKILMHFKQYFDVTTLGDIPQDLSLITHASDSEIAQIGFIIDQFRTMQYRGTFPLW